MTYTIEAKSFRGPIVRCGGLRDVDNLIANCQRCVQAGFIEVWVYACINGRRVRSIRYDGGFQIS